jgi:ribosome-associated protein
LTPSRPIAITDISNELKFTTSRSSGPGGQHVNKVNTKATLSWDIAYSEALEDEQRQLLLKKLKSKITKDGVLILSSQSSRSQLKNKQEVITKLEELLIQAFKVKKNRKPSKPTKASVEKRLDQKKRQSEKKSRRKGL